VIQSQKLVEDVKVSSFILLPSWPWITSGL